VFQLDLERAPGPGRDPSVKRVEDLAPAALGTDQVAHAKKTEVMAHGRLPQRQRLTEGGDVPPPLAEQQEDSHPRLVGELAEDVDEFRRVLVFDGFGVEVFGAQ
jgi:hypothetical protein